MEAFQYCPMKCCAVEVDASTIASDNSFDRDFSKCGFTDNQIEIPHKIKFDLTNQFSLNVCANICGIFNDVNGDSGTIRSNLSDAALAISQSVLQKNIDYLAPIQKPPSSPEITKQIPSTPIVTITNTISTVDAQESLLIPKKSPLEVAAPNDSSEGSNDN